MERGSVTISKSKVEWFVNRIDEMNAIFEDESRDDWFDGDDIAIEIARELECVLIAHLHNRDVRDVRSEVLRRAERSMRWV